MNRCLSHDSEPEKGWTDTCEAQYDRSDHEMSTLYIPVQTTCSHVVDWLILIAIRMTGPPVQRLEAQWLWWQLTITRTLVWCIRKEGKAERPTLPMLGFQTGMLTRPDTDLLAWTWKDSIGMWRTPTKWSPGQDRHFKMEPRACLLHESFVRTMQTKSGPGH